jgi:hypothetical protein
MRPRPSMASAALVTTAESTIYIWVISAFIFEISPVS